MDNLNIFVKKLMYIIYKVELNIFVNLNCPSRPHILPTPSPYTHSFKIFNKQ